MIYGYTPVDDEEEKNALAEYGKNLAIGRAKENKYNALHTRQNVDNAIGNEITASKGIAAAKDFSINGQEEEAIEAARRVEQGTMDIASPLYNPYRIGATSKWVSQYSDTNGIGTPEWYSRNNHVLNGAVYGDGGTVVKSGSTEAAYVYSQLSQDSERTKAAKEELSALNLYIKSRVKDPRNTSTDEEILNGIDWSKYPVLSSVRDSLKTDGRSKLIGLTEPLDISDDALLGMVQNANNPEYEASYDGSLLYAAADYQRGAGNRTFINNNQKKHTQYQNDDGSINADYNPGYLYTTLGNDVISQYADKGITVESGFPDKTDTAFWGSVNAKALQGDSDAKNLIKAEEYTEKVEGEFETLKTNMEKEVSNKDYLNFVKTGVLSDGLRKRIFSWCDTLNGLYGVYLGEKSANESDYEFTRAVPFSGNQLRNLARGYYVKKNGIRSVYDVAGTMMSMVGEHRVILSSTKNEEIMGKVENAYNWMNRNRDKGDTFDSYPSYAVPSQTPNPTSENVVNVVAVIPVVSDTQIPMPTLPPTNEHAPEPTTETTPETTPETNNEPADADAETNEPEATNVTETNGSGIDGAKLDELYVAERMAKSELESNGINRNPTKEEIIAKWENPASPLSREYREAANAVEEMKNSARYSTAPYSNPETTDVGKALYDVVTREVSTESVDNADFDNANINVEIGSDDFIDAYENIKRLKKEIEYTGRYEITDEDINRRFNAERAEYGTNFVQYATEKRIPLSKEGWMMIIGYGVDDVTAGNIAEKASEAMSLSLEMGKPYMDAVQSGVSVIQEFAKNGIDIANPYPDYGTMEAAVSAGVAESFNNGTEEARKELESERQEKLSELENQLAAEEKRLSAYDDYYAIAGENAGQDSREVLKWMADNYLEYDPKVFYGTHPLDLQLASGVDAKDVYENASEQIAKYQNGIEQLDRDADYVRRLPDSNYKTTMLQNIAYMRSHFEDEIFAVGVIADSVNPETSKLYADSVKAFSENPKYEYGYESAFRYFATRNEKDREAALNAINTANALNQYISDDQTNVYRLVSGGTKDEIDRFVYLYQTKGIGHALKYAGIASESITVRKAENVNEKAYEYGQSSPVLASLFSVLASPLKLMDTAQGLMDAAQGKESNYAGRVASNAIAYARQGVKKKIDNDFKGFAKTLGNIVYDALMTSGDSLVNGILFGGVGQALTSGMASEAAAGYISSAISAGAMGLGTYSDAAQNAANNGATPTQQVLLGVANSFLETATEVIPMDALGKALDKAVDKKAMLKILKESFFGDTVGEIVNDVTEELADRWVMGDKSQWNRDVESLMNQGLSREKAVAMVTQEFVKDLGYTFAVSTISSGAGPMIAQGFNRAKVATEKRIATSVLANTANADGESRYNSAYYTARAFTGNIFSKKYYEQTARYFESFGANQNIVAFAKMMKQKGDADIIVSLHIAASLKGGKADYLFTRAMNGMESFDNDFADRFVAAAKEDMQNPDNIGRAINSAADQAIKDQTAKEASKSAEAVEQAEQIAEQAEANADSAEQAAKNQEDTANAANEAAESAHNITEEDPSPENIASEAAAVEEAARETERAEKEREKADSAREEADKAREEADKAEEEVISEAEEKVKEENSGVDSYAERVKSIAEITQNIENLGFEYDDLDNQIYSLEQGVAEGNLKSQSTIDRINELKAKRDAIGIKIKELRKKLNLLKGMDTGNEETGKAENKQEENVAEPSTTEQNGGENTHEEQNTDTNKGDEENTPNEPENSEKNNTGTSDTEAIDTESNDTESNGEKITGEVAEAIDSAAEDFTKQDEERLARIEKAIEQTDIENRQTETDRLFITKKYGDTEESAIVRKLQKLRRARVAKIFENADIEQTAAMVSDRFGVKIRFDSTPADVGGKAVSKFNGYYDPKTGEIVLNKDAGKSDVLIGALVHELGHRAFKAKEGKEFIETVLLAKNGEINEYIKRDMDNLKALYAENGIELSDENALEELAANALSEMFGNEEMIKYLCDNKTTLAEKILEFINKFINNLYDWMGISNDGINEIRDTFADYLDEVYMREQEQEENSVDGSEEKVEAPEEKAGENAEENETASKVGETIADKKEMLRPYIERLIKIGLISGEYTDNIIFSDKTLKNINYKFGEYVKRIELYEKYIEKTENKIKELTKKYGDIYKIARNDYERNKLFEKYDIESGANEISEKKVALSDEIKELRKKQSKERSDSKKKEYNDKIDALNNEYVKLNAELNDLLNEKERIKDSLDYIRHELKSLRKRDIERFTGYVDMLKQANEILSDILFAKEDNKKTKSERKTVHHIAMNSKGEWLKSAVNAASKILKDDIDRDATTKYYHIDGKQIIFSPYRMLALNDEMNLQTEDATKNKNYYDLAMNIYNKLAAGERNPEKFLHYEKVSLPTMEELNDLKDAGAKMYCFPDSDNAFCNISINYCMDFMKIFPDCKFVEFENKDKIMPYAFKFSDESGNVGYILTTRVFQRAAKINGQNKILGNESGANDVQFSIPVTDEDTIEELDKEIEKGDYETVYKAYQIVTDDNGVQKLIPPMAEIVNGKRAEGVQLGQWAMSEENPESAYIELDNIKAKIHVVKDGNAEKEEDYNKNGFTKITYEQANELLKRDKRKEKGDKLRHYYIILSDAEKLKENYPNTNFYFDLVKTKDNGEKSTIPAAYNPYEHASNLMINDQFSIAYQRDNLVVVECLVPNSGTDLEYKPALASDNPGWKEWKSGGFASNIKKYFEEKGVKKRRDVILTHYIKPVRIMTDAEVANSYSDLIGDSGIGVPDNAVNDSLREALANNGTKIINTGIIEKYANDIRGRYINQEKKAIELQNKYEEILDDIEYKKENGINVSKKDTDMLEKALNKAKIEKEKADNFEGLRKKKYETDTEDTINDGSDNVQLELSFPDDGEDILGDYEEWENEQSNGSSEDIPNNDILGYKSGINGSDYRNGSIIRKEKLRSPLKIGQDMIRRLGIGDYIATRKFNNNISKALGYYDPQRGAIATRPGHAAEIRVLYHEIGHSLFNNPVNPVELTDSMKIALGEMIAAMPDGFKMNYKPEDLPSEALAEWFWQWMSTDDDAVSFIGSKPYQKTMMRKFNTDFITQLKKDKETFRTVINAKGELKYYLESNAVDQIGSRIVDANKAGKRKETLKQWFTRKGSELVDSTMPAEAIDRKTGTNIRRKLNRTNKAMQIVSNAFGGAGLYDQFGIKVQGSLADAISATGFDGKNADKLMIYMVAQRGLERSKQMYEAPNGKNVTKDIFSNEITKKKMKDSIKTLETEVPNIKEAADAVRKWWRVAMETYLVKTGFLGEQGKDIMDIWMGKLNEDGTIFYGTDPDTGAFYGINRYYVPTYRDMVRFGKMNESVFPGFKIMEAKKSDLDIINPMDSFANILGQLVNKALQNEAALEFERAFIQGKHSYGMSLYANVISKGDIAVHENEKKVEGIRNKMLDILNNNGVDDDSDIYIDLMELMDIEARPDFINTGKVTGENIMPVIHSNGVITYYEFLDENMFHLLRGSSMKYSKGLIHGIGKMTRAMTMLTTGSNALFGIRNFLRDFQSSVNWGTWASNYATGLVKWIAAARDVITENGDYEEYKGMGGGGYTRYNTRDEVSHEQMMEEIFGKGYAVRSTKDTLKFVGNKLWDMVTLEKLNEVIEQTSRYAEYKYGKHDKSTETGREEAYQAAQDVTVDFGRRGSSQLAADLRSFVPFFNASLQGSYRNWRLMRDALGKNNARRKNALRILGKHVVNTAISSALASALVIKFSGDDEKEELQKYMNDGVWAGHFLLPNPAYPSTSKLPFIRIPLSQDPVTAITHALVTDGIWGKKNSGNEDDDGGFVIGAASVADVVLDELLGFADGSNILSPILDAMQGKNYYGGNTIPMSEKYKYSDEGLMYSDDVYPIAKTLGGALGVSPNNIQYIMEQYTGWVGKYLIPFVNTASDSGTADAWEALKTTIDKQFTTDPLISTAVVNDFYETKNFLKDFKTAAKDGKWVGGLKPDLSDEEYDDALYEADMLLPELDKYADDIKDCYDTITEIENDDGIERSMKNEMIREQRKYIAEYALEANNMCADFYQRFVREENLGTHILNSMIPMLKNVHLEYMVHKNVPGDEE